MYGVLSPARLGTIVLLGAGLNACQGERAAPSAAEPAGAELPVRRGLAGRLTPTQHRNVVRDVLGVELSELELSAFGGGIPQEQPSTGLFRNGADGQAAADDYPLAFGVLAAAVAERVDIATLRAGFAPCPSASSACDRAFVAELGRLFRRPLSPRESDAFLALHAKVVAEGLTSDQASQRLIEAMLQAPAFVFKLERELGGSPDEKRYLDGFELGSRLAFFLWDSAPDDELLALAEAGRLDGAPAALPALRQQLQRLLRDPRAHRMTRELVRDFAGTERAAFVGVTPALRSALLDSMVASVDQHLWQEHGQVSGLFTSRQ